MSRNLFVLLILIMTMLLTGCADGSESGNVNYDDIVKLAEYTKKQYDSGALEVGGKISFNNIDKFENDEDISKMFADGSKQHYYVAVMNDSDTVIIQTDAVFQSVSGYAAAKKKLPETAGGNSSVSVLDVTSSLGYDNDRLMVSQCPGEFDEWYLYSYSAGV